MNETKKHILKTSLALFLQKSYRDVTMQEIVRQTGLSKGGFYHYFSSKEDLFREIVSMFFSMAVVDYSDYSTESLKLFYKRYIDSMEISMKELNQLFSDQENATFSFNFFLIMFEATSRFPEFLQLELDIYKKDLAAWKNIIAAARANGEIQSPSSDEDIANLFLLISDGIFIRFVNNDKKVSFREFLQTSYDAIYNNIKV